MFSRKRILVQELLTHSSEYLGKDIQVCGWIETMRVQKVDGIAFISLNDGSSVPTLQIILDPQGPENKRKKKATSQKTNLKGRGRRVRVFNLPLQ